ncbi:hypothetical protein [Cellulophaga fucicola]|uniref:Uncharacterized protein n=1 Tax=Cellulophaga fucicola TaxID=76595 RepID=A0A1K1PIT4_9FLAO|nr:hypothetical protein [Cellulophaga fucicola]SFW47714.1 hypothetical protein SAMN05660313_01930 [Cellulophaga fucicola]
MTTKEYNLKNWRTNIAGTTLIFIGVVMVLIGYSSGLTIWGNFQSMFVSFKSIHFFIGTLLMFLIKFGFIFLGYYLLKNNDKITRAKTDNKGLYFKEMSKSSSFTRGAFDLKPFTFLPYAKIKNIYLIKSIWLGYTLEVETENERIKLVTTNALSDVDKKEIYSIVKTRIT